MKFLTLEYIKKHSRIDFECEDALLELYGDSAERNICNDLGRGKKIDDMIDSLVEEYGEIPADIYHAGLLLVNASYECRSPVDKYNWSPVAYTYEKSIKPYVIL